MLVTLKFTGGGTGTLQLIVTDMLGEAVFMQEVDCRAGAHEQVIDVHADDEAVQHGLGDPDAAVAVEGVRKSNDLAERRGRSGQIACVERVGHRRAQRRS